MARLIFVSGPGAGTDHRLEGARISIGRDPANTIELQDSLVSKRHAEILREEDGRMRIVDVGSSNGTVVNDRQVVDHRLSHNDRIQLGESLFRFESEPEREAVEEGAKTVLIDDAATRLAIPAEAVEAALPRQSEPPSGDAVPLSTIYISDEDSPAPAAVASPPVGAAPGTGPALRNKTQLPVMPILLVFIAVMIAIGCLLTWKVVQRSGATADNAPAMEPVAGGDPTGGLEPGADLAEQGEIVGKDVPGAGVSSAVEEKNLIAEPLESGTAVGQKPSVEGAARGGQVVTPPPASRATTPPATRTTPPRTGMRPPATTTPRTVTPPPATTTPRTVAPPPATTQRTVAPPPATTAPPPVRPSEVPPATTTRTTTPAVVPPAAPAKPREVVPDATHGVLHVITKPVGATIYINEEMVGTSNVKKLMSAGKYMIRLEHQGQSITDDVKVKVQQVSTFYHDFSPPPAGKKDDDDDDDDDDDKDRKKKDKDDEDEDDDDEDDEDDDEDDDDDDDDKKKKKGFKKRLKDIFG